MSEARPESRRVIRLGAAWFWWLLLSQLGIPALGATPGNAFVALSPAPELGDFNMASYLQDPFGWPAQAAEHPDGWSVAYRSQNPPPGWERPFLLRGGGEAASGGVLHPRFSVALTEMLPVRTMGVVTMLAAPDSAACFPGKPNPQPFFREGYLFLHDGRVDIEAVTTGLWRLEGWPGWDAFKAAHPRDLNGNADTTRGNASEIYFLALLHEMAGAAGDVPTAFRRTLMKMSALPGWESWQLNAVLQNPGGTWALRYALSESERYPLYYGLTTAGEYCISDSLPVGASGWTEVPNFSLAVFPPGGPAEVLPMEFSAVTEPGSEDSHDRAGGSAAAVLCLEILGSPAVGGLALRCSLQPSARGWLDIWDVTGRHLVRMPVEGESTVRWEPPADVGSGLLFARLQAGESTCRRRLLLLR
jgi:hypothetical protein